MLEQIMLRLIRTSLAVTIVWGGLAWSAVKAEPDLMLAGEVETAVAQGQFDAAIARIRAALQATPRQEIQVRQDLMKRLATVYEQAGRWREAAEVWLEGANDLAIWKGEAFPGLAVWYESASLGFERAGMLGDAL